MVMLMQLLRRADRVLPPQRDEPVHTVSVDGGGEPIGPLALDDKRADHRDETGTVATTGEEANWQRSGAQPAASDPFCCHTGVGCAAMSTPSDQPGRGSRPVPVPATPFAGAGVVAAAATALTGLRRMRLPALDAEAQRYRHPLRGRPAAPHSADGTVLHAEVFGDPQATTYVLIPGWTETLALYDSVTRLLVERGHRVVAYDLRGQGLSARPPRGDHALARYGEDLEAVLACTCEGRSDVIVAGHSLGAMSIAAWAGDHDVRRRVGAAALMNTGLDGLVRATKLLPHILPQAIAQPLALYAFLGNPLPMPAFSTGLSRVAIRYVAFGPDASAAQVAFFERMLMRCPPEVRRGAGIAMADMNLLPALARLTVPTLVFAGALDRLTPPSQSERIAEALPDLSDLVVLPRLGHMGPLEAPEAMVAALERLREQAAVSLPLAA